MQKNEDKPIVFHTLPHGYLVSSDKNKQSESIPEAEAEAENATSENNKKQRASTSQEVSTKPVTSTIPRLISVIEIVKREFLRNLAVHHSPRLAGLHQYTEIGCLEDVQKPNVKTSLPPRNEKAGAEGLDDRAMEVVEALNGKHQ